MVCNGLLKKGENSIINSMEMLLKIAFGGLLPRLLLYVVIVDGVPTRKVILAVYWLKKLPIQ